MGLQELLELKQKGFDMFYELTNYAEAGGQTSAAESASAETTSAAESTSSGTDAASQE